MVKSMGTTGRVRMDYKTLMQAYSAPSIDNMSRGTKKPVMHVLLVDDDAAYRSHLADQLQSEGYHVTEAEDGRAALEAYFRSPGFDVIVTDLFMPRMDGLELIEYFQDHPRLRVIALSCPSPEGFRLDEAAQAVGAFRVLDKDDAEHLSEVIELVRR